MIPKRLRRASGLSLTKLRVVVTTILLVAAIALPGCMYNNHMFAQESSAIRLIRTIHTSEAEYNAQYGKYAGNLAELGPPTSGQAGPWAANLIPGDLAAGKKNGYTFALQATPTGYMVNANPETYHGSGRRSFYSDQSLAILENWGPEPATARSQGIN